MATFPFADRKVSPTFALSFTHVSPKDLLDGIGKKKNQTACAFAANAIASAPIDQRRSWFMTIPLTNSSTATFGVPDADLLHDTWKAYRARDITAALSENSIRATAWQQ